MTVKSKALSGADKQQASGRPVTTLCVCTVAPNIFNIIIAVFPLTYQNVFTRTENNSPAENRVLSRMFGPKRYEVTGEWRKLYNEELNDLYSSSNIVRVIKSRMRWVGHVARMGRGRRIEGFGGET